MYPKLNPHPIDLYINNRSLRIPRKSIASSYAGAWAAKECLINEGNPLLKSLLNIKFKDKYKEVMPECIIAVNHIGLSATIETLEFWRPGKGTDCFLKERIEHSDNPWYPFFEDD